MAVADASQVEVDKDVAFGRGGSRELLCDVYRPPAGVTNKRTAVLHLHGGGFRVGTKAGVRLATPLASRGYTCVSSQYRLIDAAKWPAQIQDVKAAIRWMRSNAGQLGFDGGKVVILGYSAGANLALVAAGSANQPDFEGDGGNAGAGTDVAACVAFYPAADARPNHPLLGDNPTEAAARGLGPINYARASYPPVMLLHGTADQTLAVENSVKLYQAFREAGAAVELHLVEGVTHIFDAHAQFAEAAAEWIDLFLDRHVANPRAIPSTEPGAPR
ncbi:MAG: alpha/beta hydrolase fold domain-containing protein [Chloroflexota bacterium]